MYSPPQRVGFGGLGKIKNLGKIADDISSPRAHPTIGATPIGYISILIGGVRYNSILSDIEQSPRWWGTQHGAGGVGYAPPSRGCLGDRGGRGGPVVGDTWYSVILPILS
jgi:hypothetical protein